MNISIRYDRKRGCGWRKEGGLYLVGSLHSTSCGKLPLPLTLCPTCGHGIRPSRGWTWVDGTDLFAEIICKEPACGNQCPIAIGIGRAGLLWTGEQFYKTTDDFEREANDVGVSRRITHVPHGFEIGKTWVLLAHRHCIRNGVQFGQKPTEENTWIPGIFRAFQPVAIEYITTGKETEEDLEQLVKRGITPVKVERVEDTPQPLPLAS